MASIASQSPGQQGNSPGFFEQLAGSFQSRVGSSCLSLFDPNISPKTGHLKPANNMPIKIVNVVDEYPWTVNLPGTRPEVPCIELIEYQISSALLPMQLKYWLKQFQDINIVSIFDNADSDILPEATLSGKFQQTNALQGVYNGDPTGFRYIFPFFSEQLRSIQNAWGSERSIMSSLTNVADAFSVAAGSTIGQFGHLTRSALGGMTEAMGLVVPNAKLESPEYWNQTTPVAIPVSFVLLNTISAEQTIKNWELVFLLTHQTLHYRQNFVANHSPCVYEINIPGVVNLPVCYINSFTVKGAGSTRKINICGTDKVIPEAFVVELQITAMLQDSRNRNQFNLTGQPQDLPRVITPTEEFSFGDIPNIVETLLSKT